MPAPASVVVLGVGLEVELVFIVSIVAPCEQNPFPVSFSLNDHIVVGFHGQMFEQGESEMFAGIIFWENPERFNAEMRSFVTSL